MTSWSCVKAGKEEGVCHPYSDSGASCFILAQAQGEGEGKESGWSLRRKKYNQRSL